MGEEHIEKVLRDFKLILKHQIILLRKATGANTAYFYWINRRREQFVLESRSTRYTNVMFQDRVSFDQHLLNQYKDITSVRDLTVGDRHQVDPSELTHYYNDVPVEQLMLIPLVHNEETIAVTALEFASQPDKAERDSVLESYIESLNNMTETYMEINHLNRGEVQWEQYEQEIRRLLDEGKRRNTVSLLTKLSESLIGHLSGGGVTVLTSEGTEWITLMSFQTGKEIPRIVPGLKMEKGSIAADCLTKEESTYISHLNGSPKRISSREPEHNGATLAVPMYINRDIRGLVLIYDENPLVFKESVKHKLVNLVRLIAQQISITLNEQDKKDPFRESETELFRIPVWRSLAEHFIQQKVTEEVPVAIGSLQVQNLQEIRTRIRLEQLKQVEQKMLKRIKPTAIGIPGLVGVLGDYTYAVLLPEYREETLEYYRQKLKESVNSPIEIDQGKQQVEVDVDIRFEKLDDITQDSGMDELIETLKKPES